MRSTPSEMCLTLNCPALAATGQCDNGASGYQRPNCEYEVPTELVVHGGGLAHGSWVETRPVNPDKK